MPFVARPPDRAAPLGDTTARHAGRTTVRRSTELEDDFKKWVLDTARWHHWLVVHYRPAKTAHGYRTPVEGDKGGPDLLLAKAGRLPILAELKSDTGRYRPDQKKWAAAIHPDCYRLWRPRDRAEILAELSRPHDGSAAC